MQYGARPAADGMSVLMHACNGNYFACLGYPDVGASPGLGKAGHARSIPQVVIYLLELFGDHPQALGSDTAIS